MARQRLDADRLAAAYERDGRRLLIFFTRRTYDAQLAVDLVAETYARAFEQRWRFAADATDHDALAAWVFGIGRNVLHEALRRGRAERRALARLGVDPRARGRGADPHRGARRPGRAALGGPGRARRARPRAARGGPPARRRRARLSGGRCAPGRLRADGAGARFARAARAGRGGRPSRAGARGRDVSARDPDAILAELGHDLRAAWARPPRRARLPAGRGASCSSSRCWRSSRPRWPHATRSGRPIRCRCPTPRARPVRSLPSAPARRSTSPRAPSAASRGG